MKLPASEITLNEKVDKFGSLRLLLEDSYNSNALSTVIDRAEALQIIGHLRDAFEFTHAEMHFEVELKD
jgi:hypothetical protein